MPNTLGAYNPVSYANQALRVLKKRFGFSRSVHLGYDEDRAPRDKGSIITIRAPSTFIAQNAPSTSQDLKTKQVAITLDQHKEVKYEVTDKERAWSGERIFREHIEPAAYAIADVMEQSLADLYTDIPWVRNCAGSTIAVADLTSARQALFDNLVPLGDPNAVFGVLGGVEENELLQLAAFTQHQGGGDAGVAAQISGTLGRRFGINWWASQNRKTHTTAAMADLGGTLDGTTVAEDLTTIVVNALSNSSPIKKGDTLVIAGNTQRYAVTADATTSGGGAVSLAITPPLAQTYSANAVVTLDQEATKVNQNVVYHRDAFTIVPVMLPTHGDIKGAPDAFVASDPDTGLSVRTRIWVDPDNSKMKVAVDALWGVKTIRPNLAVRLRR